MRPIDADALLERLMRSPNYFDLKFYIEEAPTLEMAQVTRPKAKWIYMNLGGFGYWHCSACRRINTFKSKYCLDCGAKMVNADEDAEGEK